MYKWIIVFTLNPILHYVLGLRFGKVCEKKRKKKTRKTREKRNWLVFLPIGQFSHVFLVFLIPTCGYQECMEKREEKLKNAREK